MEMPRSSISKVPDTLLEGDVDSRYRYSTAETEPKKPADRSRYELAAGSRTSKRSDEKTTSHSRPPSSTKDRPSATRSMVSDSATSRSSVRSKEVSGLSPSKEVGLSVLDSRSKSGASGSSATVIRSTSAALIESKSRDKKEKLAQRNVEIKLALSALKRAQAVDLCFVVDCTGSMQPWIDRCHKSISAIINLLTRRFPLLRLRFAFVGYRDHSDPQSDHFEVYPFGDLLGFRRFAGGIRASGGGDAPEDLLGGLDRMIRLDWQNDTRIIFHIADYPCHGRRFWTGYDDYPNGEPHGLTAEQLLRQIASMQFHYYFGKITDHTDKMIDEFNAILSCNGGAKISSLPFQDLTLFAPLVTESISASISVESRAAIGRTSSRTLRSFTINTGEPKWETIPLEQVKVFYFRLPASIDDALNGKYTLEKGTTKVQIAPHPFAQGACRLAYHMMEIGSPINRHLVAKESRFVGAKENTKNGYLQDMETQTLAATFALEFNKLGLPTKVRFTKVKLFSFYKRSTPRYITIEPLIHGLYVKYNNNVGFVCAANYHKTLDAFSHWTWVISGEQMIIVDLQGVNETLTDPAIHHREHIARYGRTNLGKAGIQLFFRSHKCNSVCQSLRLKKHPEQPEDVEDIDLSSLSI